MWNGGACACRWNHSRAPLVVRHCAQSPKSRPRRLRAPRPRCARCPTHRRAAPAWARRHRAQFAPASPPPHGSPPCSGRPPSARPRPSPCWHAHSVARGESPFVAASRFARRLRRASATPLRRGWRPTRRARQRRAPLPGRAAPRAPLASARLTTEAAPTPPGGPEGASAAPGPPCRSRRQRRHSPRRRRQPPRWRRGWLHGRCRPSAATSAADCASSRAAWRRRLWRPEWPEAPAACRQRRGETRRWVPQNFPALGRIRWWALHRLRSRKPCRGG
mmetsp:Transcript_2260/g.6749  ORF Transcript_2260/g.6749 Transcript_2260/m.6749 type:complete len:276 (+) Transcript_2260:1107-1934(+)